MEIGPVELRGAATWESNSLKVACWSKFWNSAGRTSRAFVRRVAESAPVASYPIAGDENVMQIASWVFAKFPEEQRQLNRTP